MTIKSLKVIALGVALAIAPAAVANPLNFGAKPAAASTGSAATTTTPEIEQADQRVGDLRKKLDQAKQQLEAAKAHLKAAEAEYKAAQADKQALVLREHARELASAAGGPNTQRVSDANLTAAPVGAATPEQSSSAPVQPAAPAPGATLQDLVP